MSERTNDYVREWLGAYLDGELTGERRAWVEEHLAGCPACQKELAELRALSSLLQSDPNPAPALAATAAAEQVIARLPRPAHAWQNRLLRAGLRYAPLGLFAFYAFFQAVILVSGALVLALNWWPPARGLLSSLLPPVTTNSAASAWLESLLPLTGSGGLVAEAAELVGISPLTLLNFALLVLVSVLFIAWLAGFWSHRQTVQKDVS